MIARLPQQSIGRINYLAQAEMGIVMPLPESLSDLHHGHSP